MLKFILTIIVLLPFMAQAEIIELKCTGTEYVYNSDMRQAINKGVIQTLVLNTKTRKMDIIRGVKSKTVKYNEDRTFIKTKFTPDDFILDDKILYEMLSVNRYTGEIMSKYQIEKKDSLYNSFDGVCEATKRKF
jgi:DNA polymerase III delta prime subunit